MVRANLFRGSLVAENLLKVYAFYFIATLVLVPSVTFNLIQAEVFPWALLYSMFFIRKVSFYFILFILFLVINGLAFSLINSRIEAGEFFRSFIAYLNVLLIFDVLIRSNLKYINLWVKLFKFYFILLLLLGVLQASGVLKDLDDLFKFFIPRAYSYSLEFMGGRGVTLFTSEPARAGVELAFIYAVVRYVFIKKARLLADILVFCFILLVIKSAISIIFFIIYLVIIYRLKFLIVIFPLAISFVLIFQNIIFEGRFGVLILEIISKVDVESVFQVISQNSGHRVLSIWLSYFFGFSNPFGGGVGNWEYSSVASVVSSGINTSEVRYFNVHGGGEAVPFRASGFISNLLYDAGIVGVLFVFLYLFKRVQGVGKLSVPIKEILGLFLIKILFFGSVGNPVSWVALAIVMRYYELNEKK